jgi:hypothetical protein
MPTKSEKKAATKTAAKKTLSKTVTSPVQSSAPATTANTAQAKAVEKKSEVSLEGFKFKAVPSGFSKEAISNNAVKRFHGSRMLFSWLPQEFFDNNKDSFGYMFPKLVRRQNTTVLPYTAANKDLLQRLGDEMGNKDSLPGAADSTIPAGYTYLGQFIDHDITLDVNSDINISQNANGIPNMRSPTLDLDAVYGRGPGLDPFLYDHNPALGTATGIKLLLGKNTDTGNGGPALKSGANTFGNPATIPNGNDFDVQRTADFTAIIGDPRNDENLIVSQLHHAFIKFHNAVVDHLNTPAFTGDLFTEAKKVVVRHYQWVVIHDFLKKIADPAIVDKTLKSGPKYFIGKPLVMPVEFAVCAYRFGHSMIRNDYFVNASLTGQLPTKFATLAQVFEFIRVDKIPVFSNWVIDFNLFFSANTPPTTNDVKFNLARKIDTRLAVGLESLPGFTGNFMPMLAKRNLVRGLALGLPSGQAVAKEIGAPVLTEAEIQMNNTAVENSILNEGGKLLLKKTPLWYYILKEAEVKQNGNRLGMVGSTILAETFVRLLKEDVNSYVRTSPAFKPSLPRFKNRPAGDFDMADILNFAGLLTLD